MYVDIFIKRYIVIYIYTVELSFLTVRLCYETTQRWFLQVCVYAYR